MDTDGEKTATVSTGRPLSRHPKGKYEKTHRPHYLRPAANMAAAKRVSIDRRVPAHLIQKLIGPHVETGISRLSSGDNNNQKMRNYLPMQMSVNRISRLQGFHDATADKRDPQKNIFPVQFAQASLNTQKKIPLTNTQKRKNSHEAKKKKCSMPP